MRAPRLRGAGAKKVTKPGMEPWKVQCRGPDNPGSHEPPMVTSVRDRVPSQANTTIQAFFLGPHFMQVQLFHNPKIDKHPVLIVT